MILGYLASPYSHHDPSVMYGRYVKVCMVAAKLAEAGYKFYCPISHTHPIADFGRLDLKDHSLWMPFDRPWWDVCHELWLVKMEGWRESRGLGEELEYYVEAGKPVHEIDPDDPVASLTHSRKQI